MTDTATGLRPWAARSAASRLGREAVARGTAECDRDEIQREVRVSLENGDIFLVAAASEGGRSALGRFVEVLRATVRCTADDAWTFAGDLLARRRLETFDGHGSLAGWIRTTWRHWEARRRSEAIRMSPGAAADARWLGAVEQARETNPLHAAERADECVRLLAKVSKLSDQDVRILLRRLLCRIPTRLVGGIEGMSRESVRRHTTQAVHSVLHVASHAREGPALSLSELIGRCHCADRCPSAPCPYFGMAR